jgi:hypothetical protein
VIDPGELVAIDPMRSSRLMCFLGFRFFRSVGVCSQRLLQMERTTASVSRISAPYQQMNVRFGLRTTLAKAGSLR